MTVEDVRKALGLSPWKEFAIKARREREESMKDILNLSDLHKERFRLTGRTTRMLCSALVAVSQGMSIRIYAATPAVSRAAHEALLRWASRLDLTVRVSDNPGVEFFDHTYWEFAK